MGEKRRGAFRVGSDRSVKLEIRGAHVISDAGLPAFRGLDDALGLTKLGLTKLAGEALVDTRTARYRAAAPEGAEHQITKTIARGRRQWTKAARSIRSEISSS